MVEGNVEKIEKTAPIKVLNESKKNKGRPNMSRQSPREGHSVRPARRRIVADPLLLSFTRIEEEWRAELRKCLDDCGVEAVHHIRTGTRRVEAMIEVLMRHAAERNPELKRAADKLRRQLKKIRRAAAPVRDLDVHRQLIEAFARPATAEKQAIAEQRDDTQAPDALAMQAHKLDAWLKHARQQRAMELTRQITRRIDRLDKLLAAFQAAWQTRGGRARRAGNLASLALDAFVALSDELPLLDASNLHDFRKRAKKARYMAEAGGNDAHAKAVGRAIKRVQDAIGDWHDWLCLSEEARTALGEEGQELRARLDRNVELHFEGAKRVTERMRGRLVGEWRAIHRV